jgi:ribonuclease BN (tRNA processing enzyme)
VRTLTVLGCDGSWPGPGGAGSGYLVRAGGPRSCSMRDRAPSPNSSGTSTRVLITAVILTHVHPDHWTDLESFATWAGFGPGRERFGGPGGRPSPSSPRPGCGSGRTSPVPPGSTGGSWPPAWCSASGALEARFGATDHGTPTLAVTSPTRGPPGLFGRLGPGWSVEELGAAIGTFLCEATYTQELEGSLLHLSGREAGAMARAAGVGRLIVTHRWPTVSADDVRREAELAFGQAGGAGQHGRGLCLVGGDLWWARRGAER